jgi:GH15 family glucan-1,4-alpha-glucosidase
MRDWPGWFLLLWGFVWGAYAGFRIAYHLAERHVLNEVRRHCEKRAEELRADYERTMNGDRG